MGEEKRKISGRSISLPSIDILLDEKPGWPFLKKATLGTPQVHQRHTRKVSVVNWVMSLPERFPNHQHNLNYETSFIKKQVKDILRDNKKWFNYNVLKKATSDFSQGILCFYLSASHDEFGLIFGFLHYRESDWERRM